MIDLEEKMSGDNDEMVLALMTPSHEYDAYVLHEAVEGLGASEATLIGILCTRSPKVPHFGLVLMIFKEGANLT